MTSTLLEDVAIQICALPLRQQPVVIDNTVAPLESASLYTSIHHLILFFGSNKSGINHNITSAQAWNPFETYTQTYKTTSMSSACSSRTSITATLRTSLTSRTSCLSTSYNPSVRSPITMRAATSMVNMQKRTSPTVNAMNVVRRTFGSSATVSGTKTDPPAHKVGSWSRCAWYLF
jgi:hypothetical protein